MAKRSISSSVNPLGKLFVLVGLLGIIVGVVAVTSQSTSFNFLLQAAERYNPKIVPGDFSPKITNKYVTLGKGTKLVYEGKTEDGLERVEITISGKTKKIMGVNTLVYRDKVWLDGELVEDTWDYLAQHKNGDVWYFGEDVNNYENGKLVDHEGSWLAGKDGAKPGIWVKANPQVGEVYRQEYLKGEAEDMVRVLSIKEKVKVPYGSFTNCLKTYDFTPLDLDSKENKYYCPGVGALVQETDQATGDKVKLIEVRRGSGGGGDDEED